ncbi:MAG: hypothetical protein LBH46_00105 [Rickettsiales bacterium]|jgi:hypothetical protein|nr:hypothetical protein [Rickettsiales bacterium]
METLNKTRDMLKEFEDEINILKKLKESVLSFLSRKQKGSEAPVLPQKLSNELDSVLNSTEAHGSRVEDNGSLNMTSSFCKEAIECAIGEYTMPIIEDTTKKGRFDKRSDSHKTTKSFMGIHISNDDFDRVKNLNELIRRRMGEYEIFFNGLVGERASIESTLDTHIEAGIKLLSTGTYTSLNEVYDTDPKNGKLGDVFFNRPGA